MSDTQRPAITEDDVAAYLQEHTDFLLRHEEVLAAITLPHAAGSAVSLLERQVSLLRERNREMRHRLAKLVDTARDNDRLFDKTKRLVLGVLEADSWSDLSSAVHRSLRDDFQVDFAQLTLFQQGVEPYNGGARVTTLHQASQSIPGLLKSAKAVCGALRPMELEFLFPGHSLEIGSAAVVPLSAGGQSLGILAIGARDPNHYRSSMGTLFLSYVAEVLDRSLPRLKHS